MRRTFCDRCGVEGSQKRTPGGARVVRVTMEPLSRTLDLCGPCRILLAGALDVFLAGGSDQSDRVHRAQQLAQVVASGWRFTRGAAPRQWNDALDELVRLAIVDHRGVA